MTFSAAFRCAHAAGIRASLCASPRPHGSTPDRPTKERTKNQDRLSKIKYIPRQKKRIVWSRCKAKKVWPVPARHFFSHYRGAHHTAAQGAICYCLAIGSCVLSIFFFQVAAFCGCVRAQKASKARARRASGDRLRQTDSIDRFTIGSLTRAGCQHNKRITFCRPNCRPCQC